MHTVTLDRMAAAAAATAARPRVVVPGNFATPWEAVKALDLLVPEWTLHMLNAQPGVPCRPGVELETCFVGPGMRGQATLSYVPSRLSLVPVLLRGPLVPDVVVVHVAPARAGAFSLGTEVNILPAAIASARRHGGIVVAIVNPHMPYTGGDALLRMEDVDLAVEVEAPLPSPAAVAGGTGAVDNDTAVIGERVAARVPDGATLQVGIGAVPDAVLGGLLHARGLRVWSEMISDGVLALERAGALDTRAPISTSFLYGSQELYRWADCNPRLTMLATETANDPGRIAASPLMVSVNTALEVDLHAQANAAHVRGRVHSGFGGQSDFVAGALHSPGGQAIIAMRSWHPKAQCSTIVPLLDEPVTSFQHTAVVTEHGTAELVGRSAREQALGLVEHAAHPAARDALRAAAAARGLLPPVLRSSP
jgi:acyl-CoA hydrolase